MLRRLAIFLALVASSYCAANSGIRGKYSGHQVWRIAPKTDEHLKYLASLSQTFQGLDFWKDPVRLGRNVDIRVPPNLSDKLSKSLKSHGLDYVVNIKDLQKLIDIEKAQAQNSPRARNLDEFDYSQYHTAEEIYEWLDWVEAEYTFITKVQVGVTYEGRPIYALEILKTKEGEVKPKIYYDSLIHCREWITAATALWTLNEMLTNPTWQHMIDDFDWYYIPMLNVDGYVETWTGDRLWRKTRSTGSSSVCIGTDANRNFDEEHWSYPGASGNPCSYTYYGPTPASESEVRHIQTYIISKDVDALVSVHSYSQLILYPYGWTEDLAPDNDELNVTAKHQHDAIYEVHQKNYIYGPIASTIYVASATTVDFGYNVAGIRHSYTYELRDEGEYGFELPADQIIPNGEEFIAGLNALAQDVKILT